MSSKCLARVWSILAEVTLLQLKKTFGRSKSAKEFIKHLTQGPLSADNSPEESDLYRCLAFPTTNHLRPEGYPSPTGQALAGVAFGPTVASFLGLQAPGIKDAMMYKVLESVLENQETGTEQSSGVTWLDLEHSSSEASGGNMAPIDKLRLPSVGE